MCAYALKHHTLPKYVMAVGYIESRRLDRHGNVVQEFRYGRVGHGNRTYDLPMAIQKDFHDVRGWPTRTLEGNIEAGARALAGITDAGALVRRLRTYNSACDRAYLGAVLKAAGKYEREGVGG